MMFTFFHLLASYTNGLVTKRATKVTLYGLRYKVCIYFTM